MKMKSCLIVGGGLGMGLALAKQFASQHFNVGVITSRRETLETIEKNLEPFAVQFMPLVCDISDFIALSTALEQFIENWGGPSILIYNAAGYGTGNGLEQDPELFMTDLRVSVGGFLICYQRVFELMSQSGGSIFATGGGIANHPSYDYLALGVGKTAIDYVVKSIAPEFSKYNIHVAIVTIKGGIKEGTHFSPDKIAHVYWELHQETSDSFTLSKDYT